jgi:prepilin-type N-terminal cleavage/methylation domain-containing protein
MHSGVVALPPARPARRRPVSDPARQHRHRSDEGFSLIEVMVTVLLLSLVLSSLAALFTNALTTGSTSNHRAQAAVLASGQLARAQSAPYNQVGFYCDQFTPNACPPAPPPTPAGTVLFPGGPCGSNCPARFLPTFTAVNGVTFTVSTSIVWADGTLPATVDSQAYKLVTVKVSWVFNGLPESQTSSTIVYPGGVGPYTGPGTSVTTPTVGGTPSAPVLKPPTVPTDPTVGAYEIDLSWTVTSLPGYFTIDWASDPADLPSALAVGSGVPTLGKTGVAVSQPATQTVYYVQQLQPSTTYYFEVIAFSNTGQWASSNRFSASTLAPPPQPCTWGNLTVTDPAYSVKSKTYLIQVGNGKNATFVTAEALNLAVTSNTFCGGITATVTSTFNGSTDAGSPFAMVDGAGTNAGTWSGTIPAGEPWAAGTHQLQLLVNGSPVPGGVTTGLLVCPPPTNKNPANPGPTC